MIYKYFNWLISIFFFTWHWTKIILGTTFSMKNKRKISEKRFWKGNWWEGDRKGKKKKGREGWRKKGKKEEKKFEKKNNGLLYIYMYIISQVFFENSIMHLRVIVLSIWAKWSVGKMTYVPILSSIETTLTNMPKTRIFHFTGHTRQSSFTDLSYC